MSTSSSPSARKLGILATRNQSALRQPPASSSWYDLRRRRPRCCSTVNTKTFIKNFGRTVNPR